MVVVVVVVSAAAGRGGGIEGEGKLRRLQRRRIWMKRTVKRIHVRGFWGEKRGWRREVKKEVRVVLVLSVWGWGSAGGTDFGSMRERERVFRRNWTGKVGCVEEYGDGKVLGLKRGCVK